MNGLLWHMTSLGDAGPYSLSLPCHRQNFIYLSAVQCSLWCCASARSTRLIDFIVYELNHLLVYILRAFVGSCKGGSRDSGFKFQTEQGFWIFWDSYFNMAWIQDSNFKWVGFRILSFGLTGPYLCEMLNHPCHQTKAMDGMKNFFSADKFLFLWVTASCSGL